MSAEQSRSERGGVADSLRTAVERTLEATAGTAAGTRGRAQELLDEVARRGQRTREGLTGIRLASVQELRAMEERLADLESRLEALETAIRSTPAETNAKLEG